MEVCNAKGHGGGEDRAKVKLRVIEFELEGGNASVENSIRQITNSLTTRTAIHKPLVTKTQKELAGASESELEEADEQVEVVDPEIVGTNGDAPAAGKKPAKKPNRKPRRIFTI